MLLVFRKFKIPVILNHVKGVEPNFVDVNIASWRSPWCNYAYVLDLRNRARCMISLGKFKYPIIKFPCWKFPSVLSRISYPDWSHGEFYLLVKWSIQLHCFYTVLEITYAVLGHKEHEMYIEICQVELEKSWDQSQIIIVYQYRSTDYNQILWS